MGRKSISTPAEEQEICSLYPTTKTKDIVVMYKFKFTPEQIRHIADKHNVRKDGREVERHVCDSSNELHLKQSEIDSLLCRPGGTQNRLGTTLIDNYFEEIDSDEKAYWLGFLYADGYIYERKNKNGGCSRHFEICLSTEDVEHIHKFRYCIGSNKNVKEKPVKFNGKTYSSHKLVIYGKAFVEHLINKGVVPRKSLILKYPDRSILPEKFDNSFIRGYFDGDGGVYGKHETYTYNVNFVGTYDFLATVNQILKKNIGLGIVTPQKKGKAYSVHFGGYENLVKMYEFMYADSTVSLDRKRKHFQEIINTKHYINAQPS